MTTDTATATTVPAPPPPSDSTTVHTLVDGPLGELTLVVHREAQGWALAGLYYPDHVPSPRRDAFGALVPPDDETVRAAVEALTAYLDGRSPGVDVPVADIAGTPFQRAVWTRIAAIPHGATLTYAQVAAEVGHPTAHRATGAALARNPVCLAVPCHRVVASGGRITGYAGGIARKAWLLEHERAQSPASVGAATRVEQSG